MGAGKASFWVWYIVGAYHDNPYELPTKTDMHRLVLKDFRRVFYGILVGKSMAKSDRGTIQLHCVSIFHILICIVPYVITGTIKASLLNPRSAP